MERALAQAELAGKSNEVPVGAVLVDRLSKQVVSEAHNLVEAKYNVLLHAELIVLDIAAKKLFKKNLVDYDLYVTLEPCIMCATAISYARVGKIFYGADNLKQGAAYGGLQTFFSKNCLYTPEIYGGIYERQSRELLKNFFLKLRNYS